MRISPRDIRQQQFTGKTFRGVDRHEVETFLDDVAEDYEAVLKEHGMLKEQLAALEDRSQGIVEREKTLQEALVMTQRLGEDIKSAARREAEIIVQEAEARAEKTLEASRIEESKLRSEILALKRLRRQAAEELRAVLERYQRFMVSDLETFGEGDDGG
jgi:cell division initiation protein